MKSSIKRTIGQDKYQFNQAWDQLKEDIPLELENYKKKSSTTNNSTHYEI